MYPAVGSKYELFWKKKDKSNVFHLRKKMTYFEPRQIYYFLSYITHFSKLGIKAWSSFLDQGPEM